MAHQYCADTLFSRAEADVLVIQIMPIADVVTNAFIVEAELDDIAVAANYIDRATRRVFEGASKPGFLVRA